MITIYMSNRITFKNSVFVFGIKLKKMPISEKKFQRKLLLGHCMIYTITITLLIGIKYPIKRDDFVPIFDEDDINTYKNVASYIGLFVLLIAVEFMWFVFVTMLISDDIIEFPLIEKLLNLLDVGNKFHTMGYYLCGQFLFGQIVGSAMASFYNNEFRINVATFIVGYVWTIPPIGVFILYIILYILYRLRLDYTNPIHYHFEP